MLFGSALRLAEGVEKGRAVGERDEPLELG